MLLTITTTHRPGTDTLYIEFKASEIAETRDLDENTLLDLDHAGNIHPDTEESELAVNEVMSKYKAEFQQEAVLRVRSSACMSLGWSSSLCCLSFLKCTSRVTMPVVSSMTCSILILMLI